MSTSDGSRFSSTGSRLQSWRLTQAEQSLIAMFVVIGVLHVVGWFTLIAIVAPQHLSVGGKAFGIGIGLTAYMLGIRHAFDADHIAAIDNTTRKLMRDGERPLSVGFWFSLGHSSVVLVLTILLASGVRALAGAVLDDKSLLHSVTGLIGTIVSGGFLYLIAALNFIVLVDIWKVFHRMRRGHFNEAAVEEQLDNRGAMNRLLSPVVKLVTKPWQMYLVGLLFGLGFDTATEISLLVLTSSSVSSGLPWYAILCLPVLFAAGMSLMDTIDGSFMNVAYGWAFSKPVRKIYYNLIVTGLSIAAAFIIGTIEFLGLLGDKLGLRGAFWDWVSEVDLNSVGFAIVGLFVATWIIAVAIWKYGRIEERWNVGLQHSTVESE